MYNYLMLTKDGGDIKQKALDVGIQEELLADEVMKLLNLAHDWLHSYLPFCVSSRSPTSRSLDLSVACRFGPSR